MTWWPSAARPWALNGWGDGQWMRDWCERAKEDGAQLFSDEGLICNETPDDDVQAACRKLGADLANW